jgi:chromate transporter
LTCADFPAITRLKFPMPIESPTAAPVPALPSFREALRWWLRLGCISFGGPAGQIAIMHRELVERRRWISEGHFLHALNFCMLLPGPEAQQLATYLGWRLHGARGGIAAGVLFVLPSVFILFALSWLYMAGGHLSWLAAIFYGLNAAVIAVVAEAVLRIGRKALKSPSLWALAALSFGLIYFGNVSFVIIILGAALLGWLGNRIAPSQFPAGKGHGSGKAHEDHGCLALPPAPRATWLRTAAVTGVCLALWWVPVFALAAWLGWGATAPQQGLFFSQAALITFGGAYAVLPYVAQQAVERFGWLSHGQMMSGLALAETTPGPLIMVLQFVGFVGGWQNPGDLSPLTAATLGALITTWATFVPCFLFVLLGAPHVEQLREQPRLSAAMTAITAAVVGVILNLAVKFSEHALWPQSGGFDWFTAVVAIAAFVAMQRFKVGLIPVIGVCALLGLVWKLGLAAPPASPGTRSATVTAATFTVRSLTAERTGDHLHLTVTALVKNRGTTALAAAPPEVQLFAGTKAVEPFIAPGLEPRVITAGGEDEAATHWWLTAADLGGALTLEISGARAEVKSASSFALDLLPENRPAALSFPDWKLP